MFFVPRRYSPFLGFFISTFWSPRSFQEYVSKLRGKVQYIRPIQNWGVSVSWACFGPPQGTIYSQTVMNQKPGRDTFNSNSREAMKEPAIGLKVVSPFENNRSEQCSKSHKCNGFTFVTYANYTRTHFPMLFASLRRTHDYPLKRNPIYERCLR